MTVLYLDCFSGIAGDMLVGALLDLGASFEVVRSGLARLSVEGFEPECRRETRQGIAGTRFLVRETSAGEHGHDHAHDHGHHHPHRGLAEIREILACADLPPRVRDRGLAAFTLLAESEARAHGSTPDAVHFHEVGAVDALCDVVGAALALEDLGVDRILAGPLRMGSGFVRCAHGTMPVPAPGTLGCLAGFEVRFEEGRGELVTPTGACLLGALAEPHGGSGLIVRKVGYGVGTRDPEDVPNLLRAVLGEFPVGSDAEQMLELSTNVDHVPATVLAVAVERALAAGAVEAFVLPTTMKKGRPGHLLVALAPASRREDVEAVIFRETGTLGVRRLPVARTVADRVIETVTTPYGPVRVKVGRHRGEEIGAVPEFEDCRALAEEHGVPLLRVIDAARGAREASRGRGQGG